MIDIKEGLIIAKVMHGMPRGYCAILVNRCCVYAGPIREAGPHLKTGAVLHLHKDDFDDGEAFFRKRVN